QTEAGADTRVYRSDTDGKNIIAVGGEPPESSASCPASGQTVYYLRPFKGVFRAPLQGGIEQPVPVIFRGGTLVELISPDVKLFATIEIGYRENTASQKPNQMLILPAAGGGTLSSFDLRSGADPTGYFTQFVDRNWTPDSKAVAYLDTRNGVTNIWSQPVAGGAP